MHYNKRIFLHLHQTGEFKFLLYNVFIKLYLQYCMHICSILVFFVVCLRLHVFFMIIHKINTHVGDPGNKKSVAIARDLLLSYVG